MQNHFKKESLIDEFNFEDHYTEEHMERQRALEAYGYKFIRLNRFNCSDDPVTFLSKALFDACKNDDTNTIRQRIIKTAKSIASKDSRYCKTCEKVKELQDFRDETLKTKYGNVCNACRKTKIIKWIIETGALSADEIRNIAIDYINFLKENPS